MAAALKDFNCKLEILLFGGKGFTDEAAKDMAEALRHSNCKLKNLTIIGDFTKDGHRYLTDAGKDSNCKVAF